MKQANIVFDLFGVVFHINAWRALKYLGITNVVMYYLQFRRNPIHECFSILDKMRLEQPGEYQDLVAYETTHLPLTFCLWLKGERTTQEALDKLLSFIESLERNHYFRSKSHRAIVYGLIRIMAQPSVTIDLVDPSKSMIQLITNLTGNGYRCYVLSNIDRQTHALLEKNFPSIFNLFQGQIVSWHVRLLKPQKEMFMEVQKKFNLSPTTCYYVDDQQENIQAAESVGMKGILFHTTHQLIQQLPLPT